MDIEKVASFSLGEVVAMVGELEQKQGGTAWGEETIILFHANFISTMTLLCSAIKKLNLTEDCPYQPADFQQRLTHLNQDNLEDFTIEEAEFCRGYYEKKGIPYPIQRETVVNPSLKPEGNLALSLCLGELFALVHCMELASGNFQGEVDDLEGEGILMMLHLNFSSTITLLKNGIRSLPEETSFHGTKITLDQVKQAWEPLTHDEITPDLLNNAGFLDGYNQKVSEYRTSPHTAL